VWTKLRPAFKVPVHICIGKNKMRDGFANDLIRKETEMIFSHKYKINLG
jgi:hypothetical protein